MSDGQVSLTYKPGREDAHGAAAPASRLSSLDAPSDAAGRARAATSSGVVDPSRGVLLGLYVERPDWVERIQHGEAVGYVIIVVGVIGALCAIYQFFYLRARALRGEPAARRTSTSRPPTIRSAACCSTFKGDPTRIEEDAEVAELRISEAVLREVPLLERFQAFLRLAVAAGPLLGLIGTVVGMIITFQSITESGSSDPKLMAHGIGKAMIATVLGLGIAIPLLFANAGLASLSRRLVQILDEQSTGLLAESIERAGRAATQGRGMLDGLTERLYPTSRSRPGRRRRPVRVLDLPLRRRAVDALILERYWYFSRILPARGRGDARAVARRAERKSVVRAADPAGDDLAPERRR